MSDDAVHQPSHYTHGEIETIDYIRDTLTPEEFTGYCTGNVLKYLSRWRHKGGVEDLHKAQRYLGWAIEREERNINEDWVEAAQLVEDLPSCHCGCTSSVRNIG